MDKATISFLYFATIVAGIIFVTKYVCMALAARYKMEQEKYKYERQTEYYERTYH